MIKFFRKIRQRLLTENKFSKYLIYAIGEIVLVVIGILIALGLNNLHEAKQNEQYIATILKQIQKELSVDILDAVRIASEYEPMGSLSKRVLMDSVTVDEWVTNGDYSALGVTFVSFSTNKSGYLQLMNNLKILPKKFKPLISDLNLLYVEYQDDIDSFNNELMSDAMNERQKIMDNVKDAYSWQMGFEQRKEEAKYHLNNPFYRNQVLNFLSNFNALREVSGVYKIKAIEVYKTIDSLLNVTQDSIPVFLKNIDNIYGEMDVYLGEYSSDNVTVTISKGKEQLFFSLKFSNELIEPLIQLYRHDDDTFFFNRGGLNLTFITFSKINNVPTINLDLFTQTVTFTKIMK